MIELSIIEECKKGKFETTASKQALSVLIKTSTPLAFSLAFRLLGNEVLATDVVQETTISIWKNIHKIKSAESYKTWLYRIVVNKCNDEFRKQKRKQEIHFDENNWAKISNKLIENPSGELENKESANLISLLTASLSPKQKSIFILSELEDLSHEEISKITSESKANVKANLYYARKKISELLEKYQMI